MGKNGKGIRVWHRKCPRHTGDSTGQKQLSWFGANFIYWQRGMWNCAVFGFRAGERERESYVAVCIATAIISFKWLLIKIKQFRNSFVYPLKLCELYSGGCFVLLCAAVVVLFNAYLACRAFNVGKVRSNLMSRRHNIHRRNSSKWIGFKFYPQCPESSICEFMDCWMVSIVSIVNIASSHISRMVAEYNKTTYRWLAGTRSQWMNRSWFGWYGYLRHLNTYTLNKYCDQSNTASIIVRFSVLLRK